MFKFIQPGTLKRYMGFGGDDGATYMDNIQFLFRAVCTEKIRWTCWTGRG